MKEARVSLSIRNVKAQLSDQLASSFDLRISKGSNGCWYKNKQKNPKTFHCAFYCL